MRSFLDNRSAKFRGLRDTYWSSQGSSLQYGVLPVRGEEGLSQYTVSRMLAASRRVR